MSRLTLARIRQALSRYQHLDREDWIRSARSGFWLTKFECSPVTAWRSVQIPGLDAKGHHWEEVQQAKRDELQVKPGHAWYYQTYGGINVEQISSRRDAAGEI